MSEYLGPGFPEVIQNLIISYIGSLFQCCINAQNIRPDEGLHLEYTMLLPS
jgi:hypothetical protein